MPEINKDPGDLTLKEFKKYCEETKCSECNMILGKKCFLHTPPYHWDFEKMGRVTIKE